jgi:hypothetical protein
MLARAWPYVSWNPKPPAVCFLRSQIETKHKLSNKGTISTSKMLSKIRLNRIYLETRGERQRERETSRSIIMSIRTVIPRGINRIAFCNLKY